MILLLYAHVTVLFFFKKCQVCTSQYFLWWLVLLPPALGHIRLPLTPSALPTALVNRLSAHGLHPSSVNRFAILVILWLAGQGAWLSIAYHHEMQNGLQWGSRGHWISLWSASCLFFVVNIIILCMLMRWVRPRVETKRHRGRQSSHGENFEKEVKPIIVPETSSRTETRKRKAYNKAAAF